MATMKAAVYDPPFRGFPFIAVVLHTDGSVALTRPFPTAEAAGKYVADVESELVAITPAPEMA